MKSSSVVGRRDEAWRISEDAATTLAMQLRPQACSGLWVAKFTNDPRGEGKVGVAEWIQQTFGEEVRRVLMIVDPYFDSFGLDILALLGGALRKVTVVTSLKADDPKAEARRDLLTREYLARRGLLAHIDLQIYGVPRAQLHDRYMIELDGNGEPIKGFSLSNSLGAATVNNGLLITEIPFELLGDVSDAVSGMVEGHESMLPPSNQRSQNHNLPRPTDEQMDQDRSRVEDALQRKSQEEVFAEAFSNYARSVASSTSDLREWAAEAANNWASISELVPAVSSYLLAKGGAAERSGSSMEFCALAQMARESFLTLRSGPRIWQRGFESGTDWGTICGLYLLLASSPDVFIDVWAAFCNRAAEANLLERQIMAGELVSTACFVVQEVMRFEGEQSRLFDFVRRAVVSESTFVRYLASMLVVWLTMWPRMREGSSLGLCWEFDRCRSVLSQLESQELVLVGCEMISLLHSTAGRSGDADTEEGGQLEQDVYGVVLGAFPASCDKVYLLEVLRRCEGGERVGRRLMSTMNALVLPLNEKGKVSADVLLDSLCEQLEDRIRRMSEGHYYFDPHSDP